MLVDAMLAWIHFVLILGLAGCLFAEVFFYRQTLGRETLRRLQRVDAAYGILAGLIVMSGVARVLFSPKGSAYYTHNPIFWTKMAVFVLLALASIVPTIHFIRIGRKPAEHDVLRIEISRRDFSLVRSYLVAEVALLLSLPLFAALMARGIGLRG